MDAFRTLAIRLITAASTALTLLPGSRAHGQEVKAGVQLPYTGVGAENARQIANARVDLATLPPIASIDARTDITVFLQSGVPETLRLAALRRVWTVDPAIRDFKGPQETD